MSTKKQELHLAIVRYVTTRGCGCCEAHDSNEAADRLAELLGVPRYDDDSGWDWELFKELVGGKP